MLHFFLKKINFEVGFICPSSYLSFSVGWKLIDECFTMAKRFTNFSFWFSLEPQKVQSIQSHSSCSMPDHSSQQSFSVRNWVKLKFHNQLNLSEIRIMESKSSSNESKKGSTKFLKCIIFGRVLIDFKDTW